jgi:hypothetical protein
MTTILGATGEGAEGPLDAGVAADPPRHPAATRPVTGTSTANTHFTRTQTPVPVETFPDAA